MLTRPGVAVGALALATFAFGRLLGLVELYVVAAALLALLLTAVINAGLAKPRLTVERRVEPSRVHAGGSAVVQLDAWNAHERPTPVLTLVDQVTGTDGASLLLAPLDSGNRGRAAYRLPTESRGTVEIGPLQVVRTDPFGMVRRKSEAAGRTALTVLPRIHEIESMPQTTGPDPLSGPEHPHRLGDIGDDLYALRAYVPGDDLRRVSWRATAHRDELVVRQDELPWQNRTTIVLDTRAETMAPRFERAVSAAASILHRHREDLVRLVTTSGYDTRFISGRLEVDMVMDQLAIVEMSTSRSLRALAERLATGSGGGALAMVAHLRPEDRDIPRQLSSHYGTVLTIDFTDASDDGFDAVDQGDLLRIGPLESFATRWNEAVRLKRVRHHSRSSSWM